MGEKEYYVGFSLFPGIGVKKFSHLLTVFGSAQSAWDADTKSLTSALGESLAQKFIDFKKEFSFDKALSQLHTSGVVFITPEEKAYPPLLRALSSHPFVLYIKGNEELLHSQPAIGIVGTRKITSYGRQVTEQLTQELVAQGFVTVSGLALGVDGIVHETTMESGGKTIAVLGCGVDCCYPRENQRIYDRILATGGVIVSTFPVGMGATKGSFPARNAIIAGLSLGVLVTEGAADSGSLITAEYAKKFGRPVFAVPGPITSALSKGANSLLRDGAIAVTDARDIIQHLNIEDRKWKIEKKSSLSADNHQFSQEERDVITLIENGPLHFDEIVRTIGKSAQEIGSLLSLMEIKGMIKSNGSEYAINF